MFQWKPSDLTRWFKRVACVFLAAICAAAMWLHVDRVIVGHQVSEASRLDKPRGNSSDLYPRWAGARELLLYGRDPYSQEVTREIQRGYYGRVLDSSRPNDPRDQQAFAYPLYVVFLLAPSITLHFQAVRLLYFWLSLPSIIASVLLWLFFLRWRTNWLLFAMLVLLTLGSFAAVQGLKLNQLSLLVAFLVAASLVLLASHRFVASGSILALATIKPQLVFPLAVWLILWSFAEWRVRWKFAGSFLVCVGSLVGAAELLLPGWIKEFYGAVVAYEGYASPGFLETSLPRSFSNFIAIFLAGFTAVICWKTRERVARDPRFLMTTALVLSITLFVLPSYSPYDELLLLPAILVLVRNRQALWKRSLAWRVLLLAIALPLVWSWASAIIIATASFFTSSAQNFWEFPLSSVVLPIPVVACMGLLVWQELFSNSLARSIAGS